MKDLNERPNFQVSEEELMEDFISKAKRTEGTYIKIKGNNTWYRIDIKNGHSYSTNISQAFEFDSGSELTEYLQKAKESKLY